ncbi:hypothetical protein BS47DRAFT_1431536, partial [Hydnum rufescens UP504]
GSTPLSSPDPLTPQTPHFTSAIFSRNRRSSTSGSKGKNWILVKEEEGEGPRDMAKQDADTAARYSLSHTSTSFTHHKPSNREEDPRISTGSIPVIVMHSELNPSLTLTPMFSSPVYEGMIWDLCLLWLVQVELPLALSRDLDLGFKLQEFGVHSPVMLKWLSSKAGRVLCPRIMKGKLIKEEKKKTYLYAHYSRCGSFDTLSFDFRLGLVWVVVQIVGGNSRFQYWRCRGEQYWISDVYADEVMAHLYYNLREEADPKIWACTVG